MSLSKSKAGTVWGLLFGAGVLFVGQASVAGGQSASVPAAQLPGVTSQSSGVADSVIHRPRAKAIEYSDWYARRLSVHRIGSYAMLPLFATQYYLGDKLIDGRASSAERNAHVAVALGVGALFTVNTVTGVWNLWDSRKDPADRGKRILHSALMLGADAGFALAATVAGEGDDTKHRNIALTSIGLSTAGAALMWFWR